MHAQAAQAAEAVLVEIEPAVDAEAACALLQDDACNATRVPPRCSRLDAAFAVFQAPNVTFQLLPGEHVLCAGAGPLRVYSGTVRSVVGAGAASSALNATGQQAFFALNTELSLANFTLHSAVNTPSTFSTFGGAVKAQSGRLVVRDVDFVGGFATYGGAVFVEGASVLLERVRVINNTAGSSGGAIECYDGAIEANGLVARGNNALGEYAGVLALTRCTATLRAALLEHNSANWEGGAVHLFSSQVELIDSELVGNVGRSGGAVQVREGSSLRASGSRFRDNRAQGGSSGGAVGCWSFGGAVSLDFDSCSFVGNRVVDGGGTAAWGKGGGVGVDHEDCLARFSSVAFSANSAYHGGAIGFQSGAEQHAEFSCVALDGSNVQTFPADAPIYSANASWAPPDAAQLACSTTVTTTAAAAASTAAAPPPSATTTSAAPIPLTTTSLAPTPAPSFATTTSPAAATTSAAAGAQSTTTGLASTQPPPSPTTAFAASMSAAPASTALPPPTASASLLLTTTTPTAGPTPSATTSSPAQPQQSTSTAAPRVPSSTSTPPAAATSSSAVPPTSTGARTVSNAQQSTSLLSAAPSTPFTATPPPTFASPASPTPSLPPAVDCRAPDFPAGATPRADSRGSCSLEAQLFGIGDAALTFGTALGSLLSHVVEKHLQCRFEIVPNSGVSFDNGERRALFTLHSVREGSSLTRLVDDLQSPSVLQRLRADSDDVCALLSSVTLQMRAGDEPCDFSFRGVFSASRMLGNVQGALLAAMGCALPGY